MADEEVLTNEEAEGPEPAGEDLVDKLKESIGVDVEDLGGLRRKLRVTVPRETIDEQTDSQFQEIERDAVVPGFRKGRAPRRLVEKRFGTEVKSQLVSQLLSSGYLAAVQKAELKTVTDPMIWIGPKSWTHWRSPTKAIWLSLARSRSNRSLSFPGSSKSR